MTAAKFITFEGGEGSGKSTQAERLGARLAGRGIACRLTREPGGSPFAEQLRALLMDSGGADGAGVARTPLAEALLFNAARADHLAHTIRPALAAGTWVLCDRFMDSTRAYQGAAGGVDRELLSRLERMVVGTRRPDLTLILDLDPAVGMARADSRRLAAKGAGGASAARDAFEGRDAAFHARLRACFIEIAQAEPDRCALVDAAGPPGEIERRVWDLVRERLLP